MTKKKRQVKLLASIAALAVLALVYVLVSRADWNHEEDETTEEIEVLSVAPAEISEDPVESVESAVCCPGSGRSAGGLKCLQSC